MISLAPVFLSESWENHHYGTCELVCLVTGMNILVCGPVGSS